MATRDRLDQTNRFLDVLESADRAAMAEMLDDEVVWSAPMSFTGTAADGDPADGHTADGDPARGREAFESRLASISSLMRSARFVDRRITASADGTTTFVQTRGEFVTADDRPYRNVYIFRFDWRNDKIIWWEEYANPITILLTFPDQYGHLIAGLLSSS